MYKGIIVDDAMIMRMRLAEILSMEFSIVAEGANGKEALSLYETYKPDFLTLDITMPEMNGIQVLQELLTAHPGARIVIVSAVGQKQIIFEALRLGAKDFITKPFEAERVLKAVRRLFLPEQGADRTERAADTSMKAGG